jgi:DNA-binding NarL/FixJ family response regulator
MSLAKLLIVEDDNFARATLTGGLAALGYQILAATGSANQALAAMGNQEPDVALLDLDLGPGPSGLDLASLLRKRNSTIGIIFLTSYSDPRFLAAGFDQLPAGARYLTKSALTNLATLTSLINQTKAFPLKTNQKTPRAETKLTQKQLTILKFLAEGKTTNQIAEKLEISVKAVEGIISRLNSNLGLTESGTENRRVQLVRAYYRLIGKL